MNPFPEPVTLQYRTGGVAPAKARLPRHKPGQRFLKGPIPWEWLMTAARLPGHALHVAVLLWHLVGVKRSCMIRLSAKKALELGTSRSAAYRGLAVLERSGLVAVSRRRGRSPVVTLLESPKVEG